MITSIEDYFSKGCGRCERFATPDCSTRQWTGGLRSLRRICLEAGLVETVKWAHPCYMHGDRNIVILGANGCRAEGASMLSPIPRSGPAVPGCIKRANRRRRLSSSQRANGCRAEGAGMLSPIPLKRVPIGQGWSYWQRMTNVIEDRVNSNPKCSDWSLENRHLMAAIQPLSDW